MTTIGEQLISRDLQKVLSRHLDGMEGKWQDTSSHFILWEFSAISNTRQGL